MNLKFQWKNQQWLFFSIESKRVRIRTGEKTKYKITNHECEKIINDFGPILRKKKYYKVWLTFIEKIDYYFIKESSLTIIGYIVYGICIIILLVIFLIFLFYITGGIYVLFRCIKYSIKECKKKRRSLPNDSNLKKIVNFLIIQKTNKRIFTDNCIICLNKFEDQNYELVDINIDEFSNSDKLIEQDKNNISVLNCGHQFHINCIIKWLKINNKCPICRQIADPELKDDNNKIVWHVQTALNPSYNKINYDNLYIWDFYVSPIHLFSDYSGNYNFGGRRFDCGGGATGGW